MIFDKHINFKYKFENRHIVCPPKSTKKGAPMPTYQTLTEGLQNTAVGKSFLVKGIEYVKINGTLLMRRDTGTYYTYGIDFGKMPGF